jgi:xanthine dehydrogenase accessory factor
MTDLDQILPLWQELDSAGTQYVLATVVAVEGSGYRKPGARMIVAADGRRAGTISGGCLEGEVARRAFWLTENGPIVRRYSTTAEDGEVPFGMGCGGVVHVLLERGATAAPLLKRLSASFAERLPLAIATVLDGAEIGTRAYYPGSSIHEDDSTFADSLAALAHEGFYERQSFTRKLPMFGGAATVWVERCAARPGLLVFGAGDDAIPLVRQARQLGWFVAVCDGRSNLVTRSRFPEANELHVLSAGSLPPVTLRTSDAAVIMTHSVLQDTGVLEQLLDTPLSYIGVLGPRHRTRDMLTAILEAAELVGTAIGAKVEALLGRLHAPMGLDLGGETPADIALAVVAEIQQERYRATGRALRDVRREKQESAEPVALQRLTSYQPTERNLA